MLDLGLTTAFAQSLLELLGLKEQHVQRLILSMGRDEFTSVEVEFVPEFVPESEFLTDFIRHYRVHLEEMMPINRIPGQGNE